MDKKHLPYNVLLVIAVAAIGLMAVCIFWLRRSSFAVVVGYSLPEPAAVSASVQPGEPQDSASGAAEESEPIEVEFPLELNAATHEELLFVPGIGEALAQRIISHREDLGGAYSELGQLTDVQGIGATTLTKLAQYLYLEDTA